MQLEGGGKGERGRERYETRIPYPVISDLFLVIFSSGKAQKKNWNSCSTIILNKYWSSPGEQGLCNEWMNEWMKWTWNWIWGAWKFKKGKYINITIFKYLIYKKKNWTFEGTPGVYVVTAIIRTIVLDSFTTSFNFYKTLQDSLVRTLKFCFLSYWKLVLKSGTNQLCFRGTDRCTIYAQIGV